MSFLSTKRIKRRNKGRIRGEAPVEVKKKTELRKEMEHQNTRAKI